jgi:RES domain-containing protein
LERPERCAKTGWLPLTGRYVRIGRNIMRRHPQSNKLRERVLQCLPLVQRWKGTIYRATTLEYANRADLLAGVGSRMAGARWTPPGTFNAVYGSLKPETAMAEALANYREFGIPVSEAMPLVFVAVMVKMQALLDLTSADVQHVLKITRRAMIATAWEAEQERGNEALTQAIGRIA